MIIGGAAGAAIGGPIGGLLGAAAGIAVERGFVAPSRPETDSTRRVAFTVAVIALSAKMAKADGKVTRDEIAAFRERVDIPASEVAQVGRFWDLARVAEIFGFTQEDFQRMMALHATDGPKPWDILGVDPDISDDALRRHWKALVRDHHPDRLMADGMPEEFIAAANDRLARINAAYDVMARARGLAGR